MNEPTDPEKQLRDILKAHAADSEHLLDEVLEEARKNAREHTQYWYGVRLERLKQMAKERGFWPEMAAIIANGTATGGEPPTYAQQLNLAKFRAEKAERSLSALRELAESAAEGDTGALELLVEEARKTAHDAAPAAPTLTLEEVLEAHGEILSPSDASGAAELVAILKKRLAQKGAGRG